MERQFVLSNFPNFKLSYEKLIHNKVSSDFILAVPRGPKHFIWFTVYNNKNVCFLIELGVKMANIKESIKNVRIIHLCAYKCVNTVLYGTFLNINKTNLFFIEDIFYHNGVAIENNLWLNKFNIIGNLLNNSLFQSQMDVRKCEGVNFCMPLVHNNYDELMKLVENNKTYKVHNISFRLKDKSGSLVLPFSKIINDVNINNYKEVIEEKEKEEEKEKVITFDQSSILNMLYNNNNNNNEKNNIHISPSKKDIIPSKIEYEIVKATTIKPKIPYQKVKEQVMLVKPDLQNDIYHLYSYDESSKTYSVYQNVAAIPDYKTSVLLNKLFRNIKENNNLDALEESDDEEEFENEKEDRFVFLEKEYKFKCVYNFKFKKWTPINQIL
jgi:hypothetical protein